MKEKMKAIISPIVVSISSWSKVFYIIEDTFNCNHSVNLLIVR